MTRIFLAVWLVAFAVAPVAAQEVEMTPSDRSRGRVSDTTGSIGRRPLPLPASAARVSRALFPLS